MLQPSNQRIRDQLPLKFQLLLLHPPQIQTRVSCNTKVLEVYQVLDRLSTTMGRRVNFTAEEVGFKVVEGEVDMIGLGTRDHSLQTNRRRDTRYLDVSLGS